MQHKIHSRQLILGLIVAVFVIGSPVRSHAEFRLATVDVNRVLNESSDAAGRKKELQALSDKARQKIEARRKTLQELETKLKSRKVAPNSKEASEFREQARDFGRFVKDTEDELKKEFLKVNKVLTDKVVAAIKKYAEEEEIQMVLDKSEKMRGPVLYGVEKFDITKDIIKKMK